MVPNNGPQMRVGGSCSQFMSLVRAPIPEVATEKRAALNNSVQR